MASRRQVVGKAVASRAVDCRGEADLPCLDFGHLRVVPRLCRDLCRDVNHDQRAQGDRGRQVGDRGAELVPVGWRVELRADLVRRECVAAADEALKAVREWIAFPHEALSHAAVTAGDGRPEGKRLLVECCPHRHARRDRVCQVDELGRRQVSLEDSVE